MNKNQNKKIVVGMSVGVDSSVALSLLKEQGWSPIGISLKYNIWQDANNLLRENICCSAESFRLAKEVCRRLNVPHRIVDVSKNFQKEVIDYFIKELKVGRTPNPCIICNWRLKFKKLFEIADKEKIKYVATGHYARVRKSNINGKYELVKSNDRKKDQTYSLCFLPQKWLGRIVFPLGGQTKKETFQMARKRGFDFYLKRPESQDLCFVSGKCFDCFLEKEIGARPGEIKDVNGKILGRHCGLHFYTIGQRKGLYLPNGPYFVASKNMKNNILVVNKNEKDLYGRGVVLYPYNLISGGNLRNKIEVMAKIRYSASLAPANLRPRSFLGGTPRNDLGKIELIFKKPQKAITPGQFAVFYQGNICLGGGRIMKIIS